jgi:mannose-6-phosphate isomerase-like protein (cupin superfamily)
MPFREQAMKTVNLKDKFSKFQDYYNPRVIGEVNDCQVKVVKLKGEFIWHHHDNEDELFLVVKGTLRMKFRDHEAVVREGEFVIVPRGVEHLPVADEEVHIVLIEPRTTLNTGNIRNERTVSQLEQI